MKPQSCVVCSFDSPLNYATPKWCMQISLSAGFGDLLPMLFLFGISVPRAV